MSKVVKRKCDEGKNLITAACMRPPAALASTPLGFVLARVGLIIRHSHRIRTRTNTNPNDTEANAQCRGQKCTCVRCAQVRIVKKIRFRGQEAQYFSNSN